MTKTIALVLLVSLGGCTFSPSADVIKALAGDPNSICFVVTTPWGGGTLDRNHGCPNNTAPTSPVIIMPGNIPIQMVRP